MGVGAADAGSGSGATGRPNPAPIARAHTLVEQANQIRGLLPPLPSDAYRIPDPIGGRVEAYRYAGALVADAVGIIVEVLAPVVGESV